MPKYHQDKRNANKGTDRGRAALKQSLERLGAGRSVLVDKHGVTIAGNKTLEAAGELGLTKTVEVETDGSTLVVVKRTDLDLETDIKARELAFADNRVGELDLEWDPEVLKTDLEMLKSDFLDDLWTPEDFLLENNETEAESDTNYSRSVKSPTYVVTGEKPKLTDLFDRSVTTKLISNIDKSNLIEEEKEFLRIAAQRHTVLHFKNIAEYYAHANEELQSLMEENALVIIDFNKAIELGLVELTKEIAAITKEEYGDDDI
jgi:hypothetical protein